MAKPKFIIVDEGKKPMAWGGDQLCYCYDERWEDTPFGAVAYTKKRAKELIKRSRNFRTKHGYSDNTYYLMPIKTK